MCEAALFFHDFLVEKDGYLVTCPSVSPENTYILPSGEMGANGYGVTMDNQILRDLFTQCEKAYQVLVKEQALSEEVREALREAEIKDIEDFTIEDNSRYIILYSSESDKYYLAKVSSFKFSSLASCLLPI